MKAIAILSLLFLACNQQSAPTARVVTRVDTMKVNVHDTIRINAVDTVRIVSLKDTIHFYDTLGYVLDSSDWTMAVTIIDSSNPVVILSTDTVVLRQYGRTCCGLISKPWVQQK
jgi:hypothetical protein